MTAVQKYEVGGAISWDTELNGAKLLLKSGLLPATVKTAEAALFIILTGRDLGLSPVQALRSINIIQGKVEVAADMQLGLFHRAGGRSSFSDLSNEKAVLVLEAPWLTTPHSETFTLEDAKRAKLTGDNWQKYPKAMLRSRAITAGLKSIGFDPTAGVYDYGEIGGPTRPMTEVVEPASLDLDQPEVFNHGELDQEALEAEALAELESIIPTLTTDQQIWAREKLTDGADVRLLLSAIKERIARAAEAEPPRKHNLVHEDGYDKRRPKRGATAIAEPPVEVIDLKDKPFVPRPLPPDTYDTEPR